MIPVTPAVLNGVYRKLFTKFGPRHWWPGDTPFEVAVGAILTQNTSWTNASMAVQQLKRRGLLDPRRLARVPEKQLAQIIRSSGYFNQKAKRLKVFVNYLLERHGGSMGRMRKVPLPVLRKELLGLWGIGPETADSILLYALEKPVFVVDAYTKRILARHGLVSWDASYDEIQQLFEKLPGRGPGRVKMYNEYHALIVEMGKTTCRPRPNCESCMLKKLGRLKLEFPV